MMELSYKQLDLLKGFHFHCKSAFQGGGKLDHGFWATELDNAGISWRIQNTVAESAAYKANNELYLSTILNSIK